MDGISKAGKASKLYTVNRSFKTFRFLTIPVEDMVKMKIQVTFGTTYK